MQRQQPISEGAYNQKLSQSSQLNKFKKQSSILRKQTIGQPRLVQNETLQRPHEQLAVQHLQTNHIFQDGKKTLFGQTYKKGRCMDKKPFK